MEGNKGFAVVAPAVVALFALASPAHADDALELTVKPLASGEKTLYVARETGSDGKVRAEARLEVSITRSEEKLAVKVEARTDEKEEKKAPEQDAVGRALARANGALAQANRALESANRAVESANRAVESTALRVQATTAEARALEEGLKTFGLVVGGERSCDKEPRTVVELLGIDERLVVAGSASRREVTVEVGDKKVTCTLHELQVEDGAEKRSISVWLSADTKGSSIVAVRTSEGGTTREVALEGFVPNARTAQPQGAVKVEVRDR